MHIKNKPEMFILSSLQHLVNAGLQRERIQKKLKKITKLCNVGVNTLFKKGFPFKEICMDRFQSEL